MKNIYDYIIIGAGIAGLNSASYIPKDSKVAIITKENPWDCNSFYAQGGVAVAINSEDIKSHIKDTIDAGANYCNKRAVEILCNNGKEVIEKMINDGFNFDTDKKGHLLYTKEAAHSKNRILHAGGDATGRKMHQFLLNQNSFNYFGNTIVTDLLIEDDVCYGVTIYKDKKFKNLYGKNIIIASGGVGSLYQYHTNAKSISADLQGICLLKGCSLKDMEMMQFHPTVFIKSQFARKQLISEAVRGEGATIVDENGNRFLFEYDKRGELSPRDIVSRAIYDRKQKTKGEVYLSFENFTKEFFANRFPSIYKALTDFGYDIPKDRVPITPAFHYAIGGIETDLNGRVKGFKNLYAVGEVANTGVHGANRLASNSLLEAMVFSKRAILDTLRENFEPNFIEFEIDKTSLFSEDDKKYKNELRKLMWENAGIIRKNSNLKKALNRIEEILELKIGKLLKLRLLTSKEIIKSALENNNSIGAHYKIKEN